MPSTHDLDHLWQQLAVLAARKVDPDRAEAYRKRLSAHLASLDGLAVVRLEREFRIARAILRTRRHWLAASLIAGTLCDHDGFDDFRAWVIARGRDMFDRVDANPDALGDMSMPSARDGAPAPFLKPFAATLFKACDRLFDKDERLQERASAEFGPDPLTADSETHIGWCYWEPPTADELAQEFPRLWHRFGAAWTINATRPDRTAGCFPEYVREADVFGLGRVRIDDTLVGNNDGETLVVLGILDQAVIFSQCGVPYESDDEYRFSARVRDSHGRESCRVLSANYQSRPDQPRRVLAVAPSTWSDEANQAERELREARMQDRVRAAIGADGEVRVVYSAYAEDDVGLPVDNLDDVAFRGRIKFVETDPSDGQAFASDPLDDPTWMDLARTANRMILALGYREHVFLEGLEVVRKAGKRPAIGKLVMGS